ncbi:MAG: AAA family ATPase [Spirochaetes bacterium]|nr:AAA family ATPase [Spirochaetota bacterium]
MSNIRNMLSTLPAWDLVYNKKLVLSILEKFLHPDEMVVDLIDGFIETNQQINLSERAGVLFATTKRIIFISSGFGKTITFSIKYGEIEHIAQEKSFAAVKIVFYMKGSTISFKTFSGASFAGKFAERIREIIGEEVHLSRKNEFSSFHDITAPFVEKIENKQIFVSKHNNETDSLIENMEKLNFLFSEAKKIHNAISETEIYKTDIQFRKNVINDLLAISSLAAMADGSISTEELLFISLVMMSFNPDNSQEVDTLAKLIFSFDSFPLHYRTEIENFWDVISAYMKRENVSIDGDMLASLQKAQNYDAAKGTACFDRIAQAYFEFAQCVMKADGTMIPKEEERLREIRALIYRKVEKFPKDPKIPEKEETLEEIMEKINSLVGMKNIKEEIATLVNLIKVQQARAEKNLPVTSLSLHCVFYGPPGTGKTTIARYLGKIYKSLGLLKKGHLIETDRAGLVAGYVGQTAIKVDEVIQKALDGVLFIDEAYSLVPSNIAGNDFGLEAIDAILKRMEDYRDRLAVIVAGYTDEMKRFISANPGLKSRFSRYFYFDHYSPDELMAIFEIFCNNAAFVVSDAAKQKLKKSFTVLYEKRDRSFGNARLVRNIFEKIVQRQANRIASIVPLTEELLCEIIEADVPDVEDIVI